MVMEILKKLAPQNNYLLCLAAALILLSACEKEANVKIPEVEPKPVLTCFISPEDSLIRVSLTNSIPLYTESSNKYPYEIKNAIITIKSATASYIIPWYKDSVGYQLSTKLFPIEAGKLYSLEVSIPDGRFLTATTKVPASSFPNFDFSIVKNLLDSNEFGVSYEFVYKLNWQDISGEENFYRSVIYNLYTDSMSSADTLAQIINEQFESDKGKDGGNLVAQGIGSLYYNPGSPIPNNFNNYIAYLIMCNKEYFDYHKDLYQNNDVNPFSEAKINYSNIEGGIGCFSAYRMTKKRF
jgi:hypothetical protein